MRCEASGCAAHASSCSFSCSLPFLCLPSPFLSLSVPISLSFRSFSFRSYLLAATTCTGPTPGVTQHCACQQKRTRLTRTLAPATKNATIRTAPQPERTFPCLCLTVTYPFLPVALQLTCRILVLPQLIIPYSYLSSRATSPLQLIFTYCYLSPTVHLLDMFAKSRSTFQHFLRLCLGAAVPAGSRVQFSPLWV